MEKQGSWYEPFKLRGEVPNKKPRCPRLGGLAIDYRFVDLPEWGQSSG